MGPYVCTYIYIYTRFVMSIIIFMIRQYGKQLSWTCQDSECTRTARWWGAGIILLEFNLKELQRLNFFSMSVKNFIWTFIGLPSSDSLSPNSDSARLASIQRLAFAKASTASVSLLTVFVQLSSEKYRIALGIKTLYRERDTHLYIYSLTSSG